jgi:phosphohistidine phosphatase
MAIYLVQHGKSYSKEEDPERNLTHEGIAEVGYISEVLKDKGVFVSCIKHSGKKRAKQTAEIFNSILTPERGIEEIEGINPNDDVDALEKNLKYEEFVMFVGHLPFLERLISHLISGDVDKPILKLQNGGVVCLERDEEKDCWFIKWTTYPHIR